MFFTTMVAYYSGAGLSFEPLIIDIIIIITGIIIIIIFPSVGVPEGGLKLWVAKQSWVHSVPHHGCVIFSAQTLHTLQIQASELEEAALDRSLLGRVRRSVSRMLGVGRQSVATPTALKTQVTVCDLLHSRKMMFYTFIMCSLWFVLRVLALIYN